METVHVLPADGLEWWRFRALHLKRQGWSRSDIAEALGVSPMSVSRWFAWVRDGGPEALHARPHPGPPPKLSAAQKRLIPEFLWHGAEAYGFRGEVWTCARVARVIEEEFGVCYHKDHVGRLLKELHWTPQVPIRRAIQRDEEVIERWRKEVWPELQQRARRERRVLVFEDESGFYLLPGVVRTYAPEGLTPVLWEKQTRDHLSVMGGMTPQAKVYTLVRQVWLNGLHSVEFLLHLLRGAGKRLLVIWDGSPIHRRAEVKEFVSSTRGKVWVEALPGYAPDLNPWDEGGWEHLQHGELRNVVCLDLEEWHEQLGVTARPLRCISEEGLASNQSPVRIELFSISLDALGLESSPLVTDPHAPHVQHGLGAGQGPVHARALHAIFNQVPAGPFDDAAGNGIARTQILVVTHALPVLVQIATDTTQCLLLGTAEPTLLSQAAQATYDRLDLAF